MTVSKSLCPGSRNWKVIPDKAKCAMGLEGILGKLRPYVADIHTHKFMGKELLQQ